MFKRIGILVVLLMIIFSTSCLAKETNWVYVGIRDGIFEQYYDADYCKLVNVDGYDIWKLRYKEISSKNPNEYTIRTEMYNIDTKKEKLLTWAHYNINTDQMIRQVTWDSRWNESNIDEQKDYEKIIDKIQKKQ